LRRGITKPLGPTADWLAQVTNRPKRPRDFNQPLGVSGCRIAPIVLTLLRVSFSAHVRKKVMERLVFPVCSCPNR